MTTYSATDAYFAPDAPSPDARVLERIEKLMRLALNNPSAAEAAAAALKAVQLIAEHKLTLRESVKPSGRETVRPSEYRQPFSYQDLRRDIKEDWSRQYAQYKEQQEAEASRQQAQGGDGQWVYDILNDCYRHTRTGERRTAMDFAAAGEPTPRTL